MGNEQTSTIKQEERIQSDRWAAMIPFMPPRRSWLKHLIPVGKYVREGQPELRKEVEGDPELVALVEEPLSSVEETCQNLTTLLEVFESRDDRRAVFLSIYARVTKEVAEGITRGDFENPNWVADYLVAFADLYREAVYDYEAGHYEHLAEPWKIAFETAEQADVLGVQDALLGINAHINYDLPFALNEVGIHANRQIKYIDHRAVTDVLRQLVDETQRSLAEEYAPSIATVDDALGRLDERIGICTIDECRDSAWRNAVAMSSEIWIRRRLGHWMTRATSTGTAYLILASTPHN